MTIRELFNSGSIFEYETLFIIIKGKDVIEKARYFELSTWDYKVYYWVLNPISEEYPEEGFLDEEGHAIEVCVFI